MTHKSHSEPALSECSEPTEPPVGEENRFWVEEAVFRLRRREGERSEWWVYLLKVGETKKWEARVGSDGWSWFLPLWEWMWAARFWRSKVWRKSVKLSGVRLVGFEGFLEIFWFLFLVFFSCCFFLCFLEKLRNCCKNFEIFLNMF